MDNKSLLVGGILGLAVGLLICPLFSWGGYMGVRGGMMGNSAAQRYSMMGDVDRSFIVHMIPHHEGAIAMAQLALQKSERPEVRSLANDIIESQQQEIDDMRRWYQEWFGVPVPAAGLGMMGGGMMGRAGGDIAALQYVQDFDMEFVRRMVPHHEMAIVMAEMLRSSTNRPEMRQLADSIIDSQSREIELMQSWADEWSD